MKKYKGFSLMELLVVMTILSILAYLTAAQWSDGNEIESFEDSVSQDASQLKIIASAVDLYTEANVDSYADNTTVEINLASSSFRSFLPSTDYKAHELASGVGVRAFVRMEETTPGSGGFVPKSVITLD